MSVSTCPICGINALSDNLIVEGGASAITYSCPLDGDYAITQELNEFLINKATGAQRSLFQYKVTLATGALNEVRKPQENIPFFDSIHD
ncbi:TPA: hypothetical protein ACNVDX_003677 [Citrobacter gillenii]